MKKIERLDLREANITSESQDAVIAMKLNELIDAHNELLDTHTVKEERQRIKLFETLPTCIHCFGIHENNKCPYHKEEPTTPEKKCCKNCGIDYQDPIYC